MDIKKENIAISMHGGKLVLYVLDFGKSKKMEFEDDQGRQMIDLNACIVLMSNMARDFNLPWLVDMANQALKNRLNHDQVLDMLEELQPSEHSSNADSDVRKIISMTDLF